MPASGAVTREAAVGRGAAALAQPLPTPESYVDPMAQLHQHRDSSWSDAAAPSWQIASSVLRTRIRLLGGSILDITDKALRQVEQLDREAARRQPSAPRKGQGQSTPAKQKGNKKTSSSPPQGQRLGSQSRGSPTDGRRSGAGGRSAEKGTAGYTAPQKGDGVTLQMSATKQSKCSVTKSPPKPAGAAAAKKISASPDKGRGTAGVQQSLQERISPTATGAAVPSSNPTASSPGNPFLHSIVLTAAEVAALEGTADARFRAVLQRHKNGADGAAGGDQAPLYDSSIEAVTEMVVPRPRPGSVHRLKSTDATPWTLSSSIAPSSIAKETSLTEAEVEAVLPSRLPCTSNDMASSSAIEAAISHAAPPTDEEQYYQVIYVHRLRQRGTAEALKSPLGEGFKGTSGGRQMENCYVRAVYSIHSPPTPNPSSGSTLTSLSPAFVSEAVPPLRLHLLVPSQKSSAATLVSGAGRPPMALRRADGSGDAAAGAMTSAARMLRFDPPQELMDGRDRKGHPSSLNDGDERVEAAASVTQRIKSIESWQRGRVHEVENRIRRRRRSSFMTANWRGGACDASDAPTAALGRTAAGYSVSSPPLSSHSAAGRTMTRSTGASGDAAGYSTTTDNASGIEVPAPGVEPTYDVLLHSNFSHSSSPRSFDGSRVSMTEEERQQRRLQGLDSPMLSSFAAVGAGGSVASENVSVEEQPKRRMARHRIEVVVASTYSAVEWAYAGAFRRAAASSPCSGELPLSNWSPTRQFISSEEPSSATAPAPIFLTLQEALPVR